MYNIDIRRLGFNKLHVRSQKYKQRRLTLSILWKLLTLMFADLCQNYKIRNSLILNSSTKVTSLLTETTKTDMSTTPSPLHLPASDEQNFSWGCSVRQPHSSLKFLKMHYKTVYFFHIHCYKMRKTCKLLFYRPPTLIEIIMDNTIFIELYHRNFYNLNDSVNRSWFVKYF